MDKKELKRIKQIEYRKINREYLLKKRRYYYKLNKAKILEKCKEYIVRNKEKRKIRYVKNKEKIYQQVKEYRKNNPEKLKEIASNYRKKIKHLIAWRNLLHTSLKRLNKHKEGHTIDLLGYSALELKLHIQSLFTDGMSWDNYGKWHIDHIKRVREFDKDTHPSIVNALSNLRPLWATTREINGIVYEGNLNKG